MLNRKTLATLTFTGLLFGLLSFGQAVKGQAKPKVATAYTIKATSKIPLRLRAKPSATTAASKVAIWSHPYRSTPKAKKLHFVKNYKNRTFVVTKQATLKNGLVYYYGHVQKKDKVAGWVYKGNFRQTNLVAFGDSITKGWTGVNYAPNPYPQQVGTSLGINVVNKGKAKGKIVGDSSLDLADNIFSTKLKAYDYATVGYGINDYFKTELFHSVPETLDAQLKVMEEANPKLQIFGVLPLDAYVKDKETGTYELAMETNYTEYTLSDLLNALAAVYKKHHIPYLDWRKYQADVINTSYGYPSASFGDERLHPTQSTYTKMAKIMTTFLNENIK